MPRAMPRPALRRSRAVYFDPSGQEPFHDAKPAKPAKPASQ